MRGMGSRLAAVVIAALLLAGCAAAQRDVSQSAALADAGIVLADTLPPLYDAFFQQAVEANSLELAQQRRQVRDAAELEDILERSDSQFEQTLQVIADLKRHAALLKSYFVAFKDLASDQTGGEIPAAAKQAVDDLQAVGTQLAGDKFPGGDFGSLVEPLAAYAVTVAKAAALRAEFEARGAVLNREMARQEAAVRLITLVMVGDRKRVLIETVENPLHREFATNPQNALAGDWWKRRAAYLRLVIEVDEAGRAESAIRNLRIAWESMAAGRSQAAAVQDVLADLKAVADLTAKLAALEQ